MEDPGTRANAYAAACEAFGDEVEFELHWFGRRTDPDGTSIDAYVVRSESLRDGRATLHLTSAA